MARTEPRRPENIEHIYVRDAQKDSSGLLGGWGGALLRHVHDRQGRIGGRRDLPDMLQHVERVLQLAPGGATKPVRRRKNCLSGEGPQCPEASSAGLLACSIRESTRVNLPDCFIAGPGPRTLPGPDYRLGNANLSGGRRS